MKNVGVYRGVMIVEEAGGEYKCFGTLFKNGQAFEVYQGWFGTFEEVCDYVDEQYDKFEID